MPAMCNLSKGVEEKGVAKGILTSIKNLMETMGRELDLGVRQPVAHVVHEAFVAHVPHEAHRPEAAPAVVLAEARRGVGTGRQFDHVAVVIVVFRTGEERQVAVVVVRRVVPARHSRRVADVGQFVVRLAFGYQREIFVVVFVQFCFIILTEHLKGKDTWAHTAIMF